MQPFSVCLPSVRFPLDAPHSYPFLPYHPIRVYKVVSTYASLQLNKLTRLVPLFGHFARFQLTNSKKTDMVKNIPYGRGQNMLDIYIGGLALAAATTASSPLLDDDSGSDHTVESNGSPVIIYVYGGAWDSGHKSMMMPMAQNLASQGYIVVVPDYTRYPQAKIEDMVQDVQDAVLGGIPPPSVEGDDTPLVKFPSWPDQSDSSLTHNNDSSNEKEEPTLEFKERVHGMILFSGVFDITFYYAYLFNRGIEEVSAMPRVMHRSARNYLACSPSWILSSATATLEQPEWLEQVLPKSFLLIHGDQDRLIPPHSSQTLFDLLCTAEIPNTKFKVYSGQSHLDPAIDLVLPSNPVTAVLLNDIEDLIRPATQAPSTGASTPNGLDEENDGYIGYVLKPQQELFGREFQERQMNSTAVY
ncbi:hypothetical protein BGZ65_006022 [Modicella reniformis]|uniref:BD-FAE-like domain-containing protein n=1 Tax=Modicella reniformis TaxID=1440133 RepID=A0A9P6MGF5_9FUNG|nr:hypothetical protein BGZ65_006022 [Modicella reniformis]